MKIIMTIRQGNTHEGNFTRELEVTPQECDYLKKAANIINQDGGQQFMSVFVEEL